MVDTRIPAMVTANTRRLLFAVTMNQVKVKAKRTNVTWCISKPPCGLLNRQHGIPWTPPGRIRGGRDRTRKFLGQWCHVRQSLGKSLCKLLIVVEQWAVIVLFEKPTPIFVFAGKCRAYPVGERRGNDAYRLGSLGFLSNCE